MATKKNQLLNQRLNQGKQNTPEQKPIHKANMVEQKKPVAESSSVKQPTQQPAGFGIRNKKQDEPIVIKKEKKQKKVQEQTLYTPAPKAEVPVNGVLNPLNMAPAQNPTLNPVQNHVSQNNEKVDLRKGQTEKEKKEGLFKKKEKAVSRMQPAQPKKTEKVETEEERIKRLYTEPTLNDASALPPIKEKDADLYEEELEKQTLEASYKKQKKEKKDRIMRKVKAVSVICFSLYLVFLIYGALMTNYEYNESGKITPCIMSVNDIKEQKEYNLMLSYYEEAKNIYEDIYMIDYRLSLGDEDPLVLAPEYEAMLEDISALSVSLSSAEFSSKYSVIQSLLLTWIQDDSALYVQNMTSAISTNNQTAANNALQYRSSMYSKFVTITDNIIAVGDSLNGVYTEELAEWSLDNYIYEQIYGEADK